MSIHEWMPDRPSKPPGQEQSSAPVPYILVPPLPVDRSSVLNTAGWSDPIPKAMFTCKTCKKQLHAAFLGLLIFPSFKANIDLFQFTYRMPEHKIGGAFGKETCKESGTNVTRDFERPTNIRFLTRDQMPTDNQGKEPDQATESVPSESKDDRLAILKIRLARGEITEKEFERLVQIVGEEAGSAPEVTQKEVDQKESDEELKKKLDSLSPQAAEERYQYLSSRPIAELTDAEYGERLALAQRLSGKRSDMPKKKSQ